MGIEADIRSEDEVAELRRALQRAQRAAGRKKLEVEELVAAVYQAARDAAIAIPPVPAPPAIKKVKNRPEVALVHATDWQIGKRTSDYDIDIAYLRIAALVEKVRTITDLHRAHTPVTECHLMLGGDMVEGISIFPGQAWEIEAHLFEQLFTTAEMVTWLVRELLSVFKDVHVWEEAGNHGRIGRKGENPSGDNVDRMAYTIAHDRLKNQKRLHWHPMISWHQIVAIGNYRALLVHGDEINSYGGNHPSYGIVRKVQQWQSGVTQTFRDCYMGHFHRPDTYTLASGGSVYITGSLESGNEYAREFMAATGRPSQRLHFIDGDKGRVTAEYRLWMD